MSIDLPAWLAPNLWLALYALIALTAGGHALLNKRDPTAAWGWIAVCWLFPLFGAFLYYLFGINRIQRRAQRLAGPPAPVGLPAGGPAPLPPAIAGTPSRDLLELVRIGEAVTGRPLLAGNRVEVLHNGEETHPAMLDAIAHARSSIWLASYIFDTGEVGMSFIRALVAAQQRGVAVRVLVDGVADLYWRPRASVVMAESGLAVATFLPPRWFPPMLHINLRNHRKLLVVDGELAFTGGMNITDRHWVDGVAVAGSDLHFRITGPVVRQMQDTFAEDWGYAAGEQLPVPGAEPAATGEASCRVITNGPNEELAKLVMVLLGALASAHRRVCIMTPYFLPPPEVIGALQAAALRGIEVSVILPQRSDQPWLDWATRNLLPQLLEHQVRVYYQPPPFAHTKMLFIDDHYAQIGSANMDRRSLRLNFELVLENYAPGLVTELSRHFDAVRGRSRELQPSELRSRPLPARLRDAFFWLFSAHL